MCSEILETGSKARGRESQLAEEVSPMGGPWRDRRFDPVAWRPPEARTEARADDVRCGSGRDNLTRIVVTYIAAVVMSFGVVLSLMKNGW